MTLLYCFASLRCPDTQTSIAERGCGVSARTLAGIWIENGLQTPSLHDDLAALLVLLDFGVAAKEVSTISMSRSRSEVDSLRNHFLEHQDALRVRRHSGKLTAELRLIAHLNMTLGIIAVCLVVPVRSSIQQALSEMEQSAYHSPVAR